MVYRCTKCAQQLRSLTLNSLSQNPHTRTCLMGCVNFVWMQYVQNMVCMRYVCWAIMRCSRWSWNRACMVFIFVLGRSCERFACVPASVCHFAFMARTHAKAIRLMMPPTFLFCFVCGCAADEVKRSRIRFAHKCECSPYALCRLGTHACITHRRRVCVARKSRHESQRETTFAMMAVMSASVRLWLAFRVRDRAIGMTSRMKMSNKLIQKQQIWFNFSLWKFYAISSNHFQCRIRFHTWAGSFISTAKWAHVWDHTKSHKRRR